jgi:hypothetical protein
VSVAALISSVVVSCDRFSAALG